MRTCLGGIGFERTGRFLHGHRRLRRLRVKAGFVSLLSLETLFLPFGTAEANCKCLYSLARLSLLKRFATVEGRVTRTRYSLVKKAGTLHTLQLKKSSKCATTTSPSYFGEANAFKCLKLECFRLWYPVIKYAFAKCPAHRKQARKSRKQAATKRCPHAEQAVGVMAFSPKDP